MNNFFYFLFAFIFTSLFVPAQNVNVVLRSHYTYPGVRCANICGYVDSTGKEYALVGVETGMSIVDVSNPDHPFQVIQLPWPAGINQLWKEIKVYKKHAYVVSEAGGGVQIANLSFLPAVNVPYTYWQPQINGQTLNTIHALHVDTTKGNLYLYGHNIGNRGVVVASLANPAVPVYIGMYDHEYVHDGYVDNDTLYAGEIYKGWCNIIDFTNKSTPQSLVTIPTPVSFTHNTWLSKNKKVLFATDEKPNSFLVSYDISDLNNISELDRIQSNPGSNAIVHNTHILNDYAVTSWYTDGFTIVDVSHPNNLIQVGNYDTYPQGSGNGFNGTWGVYPFLPSGTIIVSNIEDGLFVLTPTYKRACYLEGNVKDSITGFNLNGVTVDILGLSNLNCISSGLGNYGTGTVNAGTYNVQFSKSGYQSRVINNISLVNGQTYNLNVKLFPLSQGISTLANEETFVLLCGNPFKEFISVQYFLSGTEQLAGKNTLCVYDNLGKVVFEQKINAPQGQITLGTELKNGLYYLSLGNMKPIKIVKADF